MSERGRFPEGGVPRHLLRGALGFGALAAAFALGPVVGRWSLVLLPAGLVVLRGYPMCWILGLAEAVSRGRLRRECGEDGCELRPG